MGRLTFVLGGAGSGKSRFALELAKGSAGPVTFVATGDPTDKEMERKIEDHRKERPGTWRTLEAAATPFQVRADGNSAGCLLVDGLTLWVSTMLMRRRDRGEILQDCRTFFKKAKARFGHTVAVSDEVGFGVVPENWLAREFREVLGKVNQEVAEAADQVFLVAAGLPVRLKGNGENSRRKK